MCPALSVALQAVPVKLVTPACSQLSSLKSVSTETGVLSEVSYMGRWLIGIWRDL